MKKRSKNRTVGISGIIAALFIAPLVVFAAVYYSSERKNSFAPGNVDITVHEGNNSSDEGEELTKEYTWEASGDSYIADKDVRIKDDRKHPGEKLRVQFVPMWYDKDENGDPNNVCAVFNFGTPTFSENTLVYTDSTDKMLKLNLASDWKAKGWSYSPDDGCFYYIGALDNSKLTAQLLDSVELSKKAYEDLTADYLFRLDALADAIQNSGDAADERNWNTP